MHNNRPARHINGEYTTYAVVIAIIAMMMKIITNSGEKVAHLAICSDKDCFRKHLKLIFEHIPAFTMM